MADCLRIVDKVDARPEVWVRLAHLLGSILQAHHSRELCAQSRWQRDLNPTLTLDGHDMVESLTDVSAQLEMLSLILADWNLSALIQQNVSSHQHRVAVEPDRCGVKLGLLLLELDHLVEPGQRRHAAQQPHQLAVLGHMALQEQCGSVGVDATSQESGHGPERLVPD